MRATMFLICILGLAGFIPAADQPVNFSGNWVLDVRKSDLQGLVVGDRPSPYVIEQNENEFRITTLVGNRPFVESFRLDAKQTVETGPAPAPINRSLVTRRAAFEKDRLKIIVESGPENGSVISTVEREFSLSEDGRTLTMRSVTRSPGRLSSPTLVFQRAQPENKPVISTVPEADFNGTWEIDLRRSDYRASQSNITGPLVIIQTRDAIQLHVTLNGRRGVESFRLDGSKEVLRMPNGHEVTTQAKLKGNTLEIKNENKYPGGTAVVTRKYSLSKDGKTLNATNGGMRFVYNRTTNASAGSSGDSGLPARVADSEGYAATAIDLVKKQRPEALDVETIGEPVLKPRIGLHPNSPDAIVLVNLSSGKTIREQAIVLFSGNQARTLFSPQKSPFSGTALDRAEFQQIEYELDSFFTTVLDVSRGSERFYPYLPENIRSSLKYPDRKFRMYIPPAAVDPAWQEELIKKAALSDTRIVPLDGLAWTERLTDDELRHLVALQIDVAVQRSLIAAKGYVKEALDQTPAQSPQALVSNPREFTKTMEETVSKYQSLLESSGLLIPENLNRASKYLKRVIGQGFIVKEVSKPDPCPCFVSQGGNDTLYVISFGSPSGGPAVHFSRSEGILRIACIAIP